MSVIQVSPNTLPQTNFKHHAYIKRYSLAAFSLVVNLEIGDFGDKDIKRSNVIMLKPIAKINKNSRERAYWIIFF